MSRTSVGAGARLIAFACRAVLAGGRDAAGEGDGVRRGAVSPERFVAEHGSVDRMRGRPLAACGGRRRSRASTPVAVSGCTWSIYLPATSRVIDSGDTRLFTAASALARTSRITSASTDSLRSRSIRSVSRAWMVSTSWQGAPETAGARDVRFVGDLVTRLGNSVCGPHPDLRDREVRGCGVRVPARVPDAGPHRRLAPVSGALYPGAQVGCTRFRAVPVVDLPGTGDPVMDYDGGVSRGTRYPPVADWVRGWATGDGCSGSTNAQSGRDVTPVTWVG